MIIRIIVLSCWLALALFSAPPAQAQAPEPAARKAAAIADYLRSCASEISAHGSNNVSGFHPYFRGPTEAEVRDKLQTVTRNNVSGTTFGALERCGAEVGLRHLINGVPGYDHSVGGATAPAAHAQTDLSGLWTGQSSGNQVTIEMRPGGFVIIVAGQRRSGQYGDGQFFREAGSGLYIFTKPDGTDVRVQVLGSDKIRVTNPDGWTDVFTRPARAAASSPYASVAPKVVAPAEKLPPARPAKTAPWSTKAMPTDPRYALSPKYAAERADALASCSVPIRAFVQVYSGGIPLTIEEANLNFEANWLGDSDLDNSPSEIQATIARIDGLIAAGSSDFTKPPTWRVFRCLSQRRLAQLEGSPLVAGAVDGTLTPLSIGGQTPAWKQQGKDARVIASDGKSAMHCVKLEQIASGDSKISGGGRRFFNYCPESVEIVWCHTPGECERERGAMWTVRSNYGWPISSQGNVRWAACLGANTAAHVKGTFGLRYYCSAPAKK